MIGHEMEKGSIGTLEQFNMSAAGLAEEQPTPVVLISNFSPEKTAEEGYSTGLTAGRLHDRVSRFFGKNDFADQGVKIALHGEHVAVRVPEGTPPEIFKQQLEQGCGPEFSYRITDQTSLEQVMQEATPQGSGTNAMMMVPEFSPN